MLSSFIDAVQSNTLPQVSWIVAPAGYCEHPSYTPDYGAHYVNTVLQTLFANSGVWNSTALFVTYDEHDGFFDHQLPPYPATSVTDEYISGQPIGPGTRVPMLICSPWTTGGYVDSNVYDHTSMLQFLAEWTGAAKPGNVTPWRSSVVGNLTAAFDFANPDFTIPTNIPTLAQTWALTQLTGGSTTPPAEGDQSMPVQETGTRPHRPSNLQPFADVTVNRSTSVVTATLANTGSVGLSFSVYPNAYLAAAPSPVTVAASSAGSYVWNAASTSGNYNFSVYGPDGFLTTFKGAVVAASQTTGQIPLVTAAPRHRERDGHAHPVQQRQHRDRLHPDPERVRGHQPGGHRQRRRFHRRQLADRPVRLLRRDHHRQHLRRLHPPLRGPHRLTGDVTAAPGARQPPRPCGAG